MDYATELHPDELPKFFEQTVRAIVYKQPQPFADALATQLDREGADVAVTTLVDHWARDGLRTPSEWLRGLPDGKAKDAGIVALVGQLAPFDLDSAMVWAKAPQDKAARQKALKSALTTWAEIDRAGAEAAIGDLEVGDTEKAELLDHVRNPPPKEIGP